jgi:hypothetical protein
MYSKCIVYVLLQEAHSAHPGTAFGLDAFHDYIKNSLIRDLITNSKAGEYGKLVSKVAVKKRPDDIDEVSEDNGKKGGHNEDVGNEQETAQWQVPEIQVKHFPILVCSLSRSLFVLPPRGSVAEGPLSSRQDVYAVSEGLPGIDLTSKAGGEHHTPVGATLLAHCLHHVAAQVCSVAVVMYMPILRASIVFFLSYQHLVKGPCTSLSLSFLQPSHLLPF